MSTTPKDLTDLRAYRQPSAPVAYVQLLLEILGERGIPAATLLKGVQLDPALLEQPQARLTRLQWGTLVLHAMELTGNQGLGIELGLRMRLTAHGVLGYAYMSSASLRQAQELIQRYSRVRQPAFDFRYVEEGGYGRLEMHEKIQIPIPALRSFSLELSLIGNLHGVAALLDRELLDLKNAEIWFDTPQPPYYEQWRERLPTVRYGQPCNAVALPLSYLELRPLLADPQAMREAVALCERELALLPDRDADVLLRVRAELVPAPQGGYPTLDQVARRLFLSDRSLKRRLQEQGSSFMQLLDEARLRDASRLLEHSTLDIQAIAERLGYVDRPNFSRAFQRWTGESPGAWRKRRRA